MPGEVNLRATLARPVMPAANTPQIAYLLLTPLGLFTLDSSSWQTRGHQGAPAPAPQGVPR